MLGAQRIAQNITATITEQKPQIKQNDQFRFDYVGKLL